MIGLIPASLLAIPLFGISIFKLGVFFSILLITLYLFVVANLGLLVTSGLIRFGPLLENIAWASLFFLAPLVAFIIQLKLPNWLQVVSKLLPLVHIFEETRNILINEV